LGKKIYYQRTVSGSEIVRFVLKADHKFEKNQWAGIYLTTVTEHWTNCVRNKCKVHVIYLIWVKNQLTVELRADDVQPILYIIYIIYYTYMCTCLQYFGRQNNILSVRIWNSAGNKSHIMTHMRDWRRYIVFDAVLFL